MVRNRMSHVKLLFTSERGRCTLPPSLALLTRPNFTQNKEKKKHECSATCTAVVYLIDRQSGDLNDTMHQLLVYLDNLRDTCISIKQNLFCNLL